MRTFDLWLEKECSSEQAAPVLERNRNVVVTAGAGSGKTRTLVSRYLSLLIRYKDPRRVVAITFTDKAAEEMRARTRSSILKLISLATDPEEITELRRIYSALDTARISTIHGLCMEILLDNPAKAGIDPASTVLDEVAASLLKRKVIKETFERISDDPRFDQVFLNISIDKANRIFSFMLDNRLKLKDVLPTLAPATQTSQTVFDAMFQDPALTAEIEELRGYTDDELEAVKRKFEVGEILTCWEDAGKNSAAGNNAAAARILFTMRYNHLKLTSNKRPAMQTLKRLQTTFDEKYGSLLGFSSDMEFDPLDEKEYELIREGLLTIFEMMNESYETALRETQALDFDSMEDYAVRLLRDTEVCANWRSKVDSLMVDEFQDTNERQREIILSLTHGSAGKLFVVGDARQSIYRFRQADVTVFRKMIFETELSVGAVMELNTSYRTHARLVSAVGSLLAPIMGTEPDPLRDYRVHFTPLNAFKAEPEKYTESPFVDFILANTEAVYDPRDTMAYALAERLIKARREEEINSWGDVAILCRTANSFRHYEDALDEAGIPYVTSSGKGFLRRPEVRDLINVLRALSEPTNDLVMAGLLRSPMFGLSDAALYLLRPTDDKHFIDQIQGELTMLSRNDALHAQQTADRLQEMLGWVDRLPVADLIKKVVDVTHFTSILAAANKVSGSQRQWRNIEKLIDTARRSGLILLRDFLELIDNYEEVGQDMGEAPSEAMDAVKLMTIHASKGLEFRWVVLGDAARNKIPAIPKVVLFNKKTGLAFFTERYNLHFNLSIEAEESEEVAELDRLLYVALTRAKDKLVINGVRTLNKDGLLKGTSWLVDLGNALNTNFDEESPNLSLGDDLYNVSISALTSAPRWKGGPISAGTRQISMDELTEVSLIRGETQSSPSEEPENPPSTTASLFHKHRDQVRRAEGSLVHKAIELDMTPGNEAFSEFARGFIYNAGFSEETVVNTMVERVEILLERYSRHPISSAIRESDQVFHELRYTLPTSGYAYSGIIDLLVKLPEGWVILDYKTDMLRSDEELKAALEAYRPQLQGYKAALYNIQKILAVPKICFLDDNGEVSIYNA